MKKLLSFFLIFFFFLFLSSYAHANSNFSTFYEVTYNVSDKETTRVIIDVELLNDTTDYYASSYSIQTGFSEISNIKGNDLGGNLKVVPKKNDRGTLLSFNFNKKIVGIGKSQQFSVSFDSSEVAKRYGSIWEINIPGVSDQEQYSSFNVNVNVPDSFGNPEIIKPQAKFLKLSGKNLTFSKEDLGEGGISIAYGESQVYTFDLTYHLQNKNLFPLTSEIAIPSDNNYQEIKIKDIKPRPVDVVIDKDGNWLAKYKLLPSQDIKVLVIGSAKVSYKPRVEEISEEQKNLYLRPQKYWEVDNAEIKKLAARLKTAEAIYRYVVNNLKYDKSRIKEVQLRAGGAGSLNNKNSAVCLEFTDLFVSLARSAGIPARSVEGYANTSNVAKRPLSLFKDVLHSWPEYYDFNKKAWIMVDPTWENTTGGIDYFKVFDFDHLAFVIKGENSEYPIPAGGYKTPGQQSTQDVRVTTSKIFEKTQPTLSTSTNFSKAYFGGLPITGEIIISNDSGVLAPNQTVGVSSDRLEPSSQNLYFDKIPPYGKKTIFVKFSPLPVLTNERDTIKIAIGAATLEKEIVVSPFYKHIYFLVAFGGIILGSAISIISFVAYKRRRIPVS
ncbi:MAG: transglutaminase domain-containing protein [Candidatus Levybacteria bacterium]|nr:transglutaminase domain-containing protein [Candidatus Levybacteria bacterium]